MASVRGMVEGWIAGNGDYPLIDEPGILDMVWAATSDPGVLSEAAAAYTQGTHPHHRACLDLLVKAGADEHVAQQVWADRQKRPGWNPPQADGYRGQ